jgi:hypothetical protein
MSGGERLRHQEVWELIPWYVNGTLEADEAARVEAHLARCPLCRREAEANRGLAAALREAEPAVVEDDPRLERLLARLDEPDETVAGAPAPAAAGRFAWWRSTPGPARRLVVAQLAAVLLLAVAAGWLAARPAAAPRSHPAAEAPPPDAAPPARFRTLSRPPAAADLPAAGDEATVRLLFAAGTGEVEMRRLLLAEGGRFVGGPSPTGVYTAAFAAPAAEVDAVVERLRAAESVELAEPVRPRRGEAP